MNTSLISNNNAIQLLIEKKWSDEILGMIDNCLAACLVNKENRDSIIDWLGIIFDKCIITDVKKTIVQNFLNDIYEDSNFISKVNKYLDNHYDAIRNVWEMPCSEIYTFTANHYKSYEYNSQKIIADLLSIVNNYTNTVPGQNPDAAIETSDVYLLFKDKWLLNIQSQAWNRTNNDVHHVEFDETNSNFLRITHRDGSKWMVDINNPSEYTISTEDKILHVEWDKIYTLDAIGTIKRDLKLYMDNNTHRQDWFAYLTDKYIKKNEHEQLLITVRPKVYYMDNNQLMEWVLKPDYNITNLNFWNYRVTKEIKGFMKNSVVQYDKLNLDMFDRELLEPIYTSLTPASSEKK
jgi:hypothetical protein